MLTGGMTGIKMQSYVLLQYFKNNLMQRIELNTTSDPSECTVHILNTAVPPHR